MRIVLRFFDIFNRKAAAAFARRPRHGGLACLPRRNRPKGLNVLSHARPLTALAFSHSSGLAESSRRSQHPEGAGCRKVGFAHPPRATGLALAARKDSAFINVLQVQQDSCREKLSFNQLFARDPQELSFLEPPGLAFARTQLLSMSSGATGFAPRKTHL